jgi:hypothetical protein
MPEKQVIANLSFLGAAFVCQASPAWAQDTAESPPEAAAEEREPAQPEEGPTAEPAEAMVDVVVVFVNGSSLQGRLPASELVLWEKGQDLTLYMDQGSYTVPGERIDSLSNASIQPKAASWSSVGRPPLPEPEQLDFPEKGAAVEMLLGLGVSDTTIGPAVEFGLHTRFEQSSYLMRVIGWQPDVDTPRVGLNLGYSHLVIRSVKPSFWPSGMLEYIELGAGLLLSDQVSSGLVLRADHYKGSRVLGSRTSVFGLVTLGSGVFVGVSAGPSLGWH